MRTYELRDVFNVCPQTYGAQYRPHFVKASGVLLLEGLIEVRNLRSFSYVMNAVQPVHLPRCQRSPACPSLSNWYTYSCRSYQDRNT
jgi:hypothetical protein